MDTLKRVDVRREWSNYLRSITRSNKTGDAQHCVLKVKGGNPRITVPAPIWKLIAPPNSVSWSSKKVACHWVVAWLHKIKPDQSIDGWERFELSERCISPTCITPDCLVWESKSTNQSRGHMKNCCRKQCSHCSTRLCVCQALHTPPCTVHTD
jgi:hypothetical protein